jgi:hypothetical protein
MWCVQLNILGYAQYLIAYVVTVLTVAVCLILAATVNTPDAMGGFPDFIRDLAAIH